MRIFQSVCDCMDMRGKRVWVQPKGAVHARRHSKNRKQLFAGQSEASRCGAWLWRFLAGHKFLYCGKKLYSSDFSVLGVIFLWGERVEFDEDVKFGRSAKGILVRWVKLHLKDWKRKKEVKMGKSGREAWNWWVRLINSSKAKLEQTNHVLTNMRTVWKQKPKVGSFGN